MLLRIAPHLIEPLAFVLPHEPHLRPAWMIRVGLFLYDHLGGRMTLPKSFGVDLARAAAGARACSRASGAGFVYADARVDDARLVVVNALDGAGARRRYPRAHAARRRARATDGLWRATLAAPTAAATR